MLTQTLDHRTSAPISTAQSKPAKAPKEWLMAMLERAHISKHGIWGGAIELTPERAEYLLSRNAENRAIKQNKVKEILDDITDGRWRLNGEPIIISSGGDLNDGQHRCLAVVNADRAILTAIIVGAERLTRTTIDTGSARTTGDLLSMEGIADHNAMAAAGAIMLVLSRGGMRTGKDRSNVAGPDGRPTKTEKHEFAVKNIAELHRAFQALPKQGSALLGSRSRLAGVFAHMVHMTRNYDEVSEFFDQFVNGNNLARGAPAYAARERLLSLAQIGQVPPWKTVEIIFRAWNSYRRGDPMSRVVLSGNIPDLIV